MTAWGRGSPRAPGRTAHGHGPTVHSPRVPQSGVWPTVATVRSQSHNAREKVRNPQATEAKQKAAASKAGKKRKKRKGDNGANEDADENSDSDEEEMPAGITKTDVEVFQHCMKEKYKKCRIPIVSGGDEVMPTQRGSISSITRYSC